MDGSSIQTGDLEVGLELPARGATRFIERFLQFGLFQSTRPRGARPVGWRRFGRRSRCFNPRARAGRDYTQRAPTHRLTAFQSTRPRGA
jgi:hypothetical protein